MIVAIPAWRKRSPTASLAVAPKIASGAVLRRDDRRGELDAHVVGAGGRHQRELIQRQLPRQARGRDERDALDVAPLDVLDQPVHRLIQAAVIDRQRVLVAGSGLRAERQHQRVVLDRRAGGGVQQLLGGLDPFQRVGQQLGAGVVHDRRERVAVGGRIGERLAHRQRPVDELGGRRDHGGGEALGCELV